MLHTRGFTKNTQMIFANCPKCSNWVKSESPYCGLEKIEIENGRCKQYKQRNKEVTKNDHDKRNTHC